MSILSTVHAVQARQAGGPEVMELVELPKATPGPGEVLVKIEAAGVNFIDIYHRTGQYKVPLPMRLGLEGAGVIEGVGNDVTGLREGDRVAWVSAPGSYATHAIVAAEQVVKVPAGVAARTAAAVMLQGMTAHYLVESTYPLAPGDTCLVHAAAGGVGLLLCQMAKRRGALVIGTVSTEEKVERARAAGADYVILSGKAELEAEVRRITAGRGVSVVYDSIGKDTFDQGLCCLRPRGMLVLYGQSSGAVPPLDPQVLAQRGSVFLTRPRLADYMATREELDRRADDIFRWIEAGELSVTIDSAFPLTEASAAHRRLASRKTIGKVLLTPS